MPSDREPLFKIYGDTGEPHSPDARVLRTRQLEKVGVILKECGWKVSKMGGFLFSALADGPRAVSVESLRFALFEAGLIENPFASNQVTNVTFSPRKRVEKNEEQGCKNDETESPPGNSISDRFDLGDWR